MAPTQRATQITRLHRYTVACLSGTGIGPEVMAEASRTLAELSALHGFRIDEVHPPFGDEAIARSGHALPSSTLHATRSADAVLVAGSSRAALERIEAELEPSTSVVQTRLTEGGKLVLLAPLRDGHEERTIERSFQTARAGAGRIASVGGGSAWQRRIDHGAERHGGVAVEHLTLAAAVHRLATSSRSPGAESHTFLIAEQPLADALLEVAHIRGGDLPAATGLLGEIGPGIFYPSPSSTHESAGHGVANPSSMLIAAALLLREGLGRHAAAETLEAGVAAALLQPVATPDRAPNGSLAASTREFVDLALGLHPGLYRNVGRNVGRGVGFAIGGSA